MILMGWLKKSKKDSLIIIETTPIRCGDEITLRESK